MQRIAAIASNTFLETIRQPIYGILLVVTCFLMIMNVALASFTLSDDNLFLHDLGLSTLLVSGLFLAAFSSAGVVSREIENKTVLTLISKPISRPALLLGKFIGLISALTTAYYIGTLAFLLVVRHRVMMNTTDPWDFPVILFGFGAVLFTVVVAGVGNYWYGWQFSSAAVGLFAASLTAAYVLVAVIDRNWHFQFPHLGDGQLLAAVFLVLLMVWILTAVALAASCRMGQVATLAICMLVVMAGLTSDYFFGQHHLSDRSFLGQPGLSARFSYLAYRVVPNLGVFWVADALAAGKKLSAGYLGSALAYAALYITAILTLAVAVFQKREVG